MTVIRYKPGVMGVFVMLGDWLCPVGGLRHCSRRKVCRGESLVTCRPPYCVGVHQIPGVLKVGLMDPCGAVHTIRVFTFF